MGIYVNTNVSALRGQNYLNNVNNNLNTTYQRLSSGLRINSAKDDAAGLQISDRLTAQINGLNQGNRNSNDAIALAQTIEGGLDEITNNLQRMRTLAVQAANGINTKEDRESIQKEITALATEINRIAEQTTYGGKKVLFGADGATAGAETIYQNTGTAASAAGKIRFQVGANNGDAIEMTVESFALDALISRASASTGANGATIDVVAECAARCAISDIDKMLAIVDTQRADLGAMQNRLESAIRVQSNVSVNESDARSRIRDTDFAEESANLSQQSIIQQAATSMLMQANARPQIGLSLLG